MNGEEACHDHRVSKDRRCVAIVRGWWHTLGALANRPCRGGDRGGRGDVVWKQVFRPTIHQAY